MCNHVFALASDLWKRVECFNFIKRHKYKKIHVKLKSWNWKIRLIMKRNFSWWFCIFSDMITYNVVKHNEIPFSIRKTKDYHNSKGCKKLENHDLDKEWGLHVWKKAAKQFLTENNLVKHMIEFLFSVMLFLDLMRHPWIFYFAERSKNRFFLKIKKIQIEYLNKRIPWYMQSNNKKKPEMDQ